MALRSGESEPRGGLGRLFGFQESVRELELREGQEPGSVTVRLMNFKNSKETQPYIDFLNDMRNSSHFVRPPKTVDVLREIPKKYPGNHFLVATTIEQIEQEGEVKNVERTIGGALIDDQAFGEADAGLRLFVLDPNRQGQGLGEKMYLEVLLWGFLTATHDGRHRIEIDFSVVLNKDAMLRVLGTKNDGILNNHVKRLEAIKKLKDERHVSTRMIRLGEKYGAAYIYSKPKEATEVLGFTDPQPTARYEVRLDAFKTSIRENPDALKLVQTAGLTDFLQI